MRFILANLQKNCRIRLNYFKADSLFKNNLHIKTEPVTDGADTKNQTYIVASAPSVTGSVFMQRFKLNFLEQCFRQGCNMPKTSKQFCEVHACVVFQHVAPLHVALCQVFRKMLPLCRFSFFMQFIAFSSVAPRILYNCPFQSGKNYTL